MCEVYFSIFVHGRVTDVSDDISEGTVQRQMGIYA